MATNFQFADCAFLVLLCGHRALLSVAHICLHACVSMFVRGTTCAGYAVWPQATRYANTNEPITRFENENLNVSAILVYDTYFEQTRGILSKSLLNQRNKEDSSAVGEDRSYYESNDYSVVEVKPLNRRGLTLC